MHKCEFIGYVIFKANVSSKMLLLSRAIMTKFERRWNFLTLLIRKKNVDKSAHLIALTMKLCEKLCFYLEDFKPVNYGIMNDRSWLKPQWFQCVKHAISGSGNGRIWECIQKEFKYKGQFIIFFISNKRSIFILFTVGVSNQCCLTTLLESPQ